MMIKLFQKKFKDKPGYYQGKHYTQYVEDVKALKREKKLNETEQLLLALINTIETQHTLEGSVVPPWYYEQLAIIYRSRKDYEAEVKILERYETLAHISKKYMIERLEKARILLEFQQRGRTSMYTNEDNTNEINTTE